MKVARLSVVIASLFAASHALAQQPATPSPVPAPAKAEEEMTEKITVTARRREETLQDVPVSVTAFTADTLSKLGLSDISALQTTIPNTTLTASRGTNSTLTSFIRGVGQQDPVAGYESGVGIYLDDVYLARPQGALVDIYDVERIEVLRGPQGTLYGRNTIGGAIKYVTRRMGNQNDLRLKAALGTFKQMDIALTGSTALSDSVKIGGTVAKFTRDGFGTNLSNGDENYNKDVTAARLSLEFTPSSNLFVRLAGDYSQDKSNPRHGHRVVAGPGEQLLSNEYDSNANLTKVLGRSQEVRADGFSAMVEYNITNDLMFKSITAKRKDKSHAPIDFDARNTPDFDVPAIYENKQFSQEFQLNYTGKRWQGIAGVYYLDANAYNKFDVRLNLPALPNTAMTEDDVDTKAWAIFADASFDVTNDLSLSIGGRYTEDERKASILRKLYLGNAGSVELGVPGAVLAATQTNLSKNDLQRTDKKFTPRISLGWKASPDHNLYASISQGFKGGSFDPRLNLATAGLTLAKAKEGFKPEEITTYELGFKSQFDKGRVLLNGAVFKSDYKEVQIPGSIAVDTNGDGVDDSFAGVTTNAGKAKINGFELEMMARVTDAFSITAMYGYIDAKFTKFVGAGNIDVASQRKFQNTPENTANIRATYEWPMSAFNKRGKLALTGGASFRDDTQQFEFALPTLDQKAYTLYDASLVWTSSDSKLRVGLHGKNLTDERYKIAGYNFPTLPTTASPSVLAFYGNPRTVTLNLDYKF
jgi:iron complex outermembrane recepter protein